MSSEQFWSLTWYDWNLWVERIIWQREKEKHKEELEWVRLSELLTPIYNYMRDSKTTPDPFKPTDFYKPSWYKEPKKKKSKLLKPEEVEKLFPKTLPKINEQRIS